MENFQVVMAQEDNLSQYQAVVNNIINMAWDSENVVLPEERIKKGVKYIFDHSEIAFYYIVKANENYIGLNLLSADYDLKTDQLSWTIGSLNVEANYRKQGVFSNYILKADEDFIKNNKNYKQVIKLYMDKDNERAQKAYFKNGFSLNLNQTVFEKDILSTSKNIIFSTLEEFGEFEVKLALLDDLDEIKSFLPLSQINFCNKETFKNDYQKHFKGIEKILSDTKYEKLFGRIICIKYQSKLVGLSYISYEPSDWRSSMMWWVYDLFFNEEFLKDKVVSEILTYTINSIFLLFEKFGNCIRFYISNEYLNDNQFVKDLEDKCVASRSHYLLFEKKLE